MRLCTLQHWNVYVRLQTPQRTVCYVQIHVALDVITLVNLLWDDRRSLEVFTSILVFLIFSTLLSPGTTPLHLH